MVMMIIARTQRIGSCSSGRDTSDEVDRPGVAFQLLFDILPSRQLIRQTCTGQQEAEPERVLQVEPMNGLSAVQIKPTRRANHRPTTGP